MILREGVRKAGTESPLSSMFQKQQTVNDLHLEFLETTRGV
jgi:hypothetical protein